MITHFSHLVTQIKELPHRMGLEGLLGFYVELFRDEGPAIIQSVPSRTEIHAAHITDTLGSDEQLDGANRYWPKPGFYGLPLGSILELRMTLAVGY